MRLTEQQISEGFSERVKASTGDKQPKSGADDGFICGLLLLTTVHCLLLTDHDYGNAPRGCASQLGSSGCVRMNRDRLGCN